MRCEVCGRKIHSSPITALIEGARLTVCVECSKHGKIITREEAEMPQASSRKPAPSFSLTVQKKKPEAKVQITEEVVEEYHTKIRKAREKLGLSHEELGKRINEKASVIKNLETGKMAPNDMLVTKLEHALKIKLLAPISEEKVPQSPKAPDRELTLGDLIEFDKKGREEPTGRKQS